MAIGSRCRYCLLFIFLFFVTLVSSRVNTLTAKPIIHQTSTSNMLGAMSRFMGEPNHSITANGDSIRILALRVEFQEDNVATTTGNGLFDLSSTSEYIIDRPPHNRAYFQYQMIALANYFNRVSNGHVQLSSDVYPLDNDSAYQLPHDMVYYSGREDEELQKRGWAELLRDAVTIAAANDDIDFSSYHSFFVFHAGVGADISFDFDPTPYDIQSAYIDLATLEETIGNEDPAFKGIEVQPNVFIKDGIILPETQNQNDQNLGLLGTMTLLMGSQLGMPTLFDTETGQAGVGRWGLMDQGSFNFRGLLPAEPCAWTKLYMGWEKAIEITNARDLQIASPHAQGAPRLVKIPINSDEYYLIENRQRDPNGDGVTVAFDAAERQVVFDSLGQINTETKVGVLVSVQEYDYGLPGSGLLIWHIDEGVIRQNLASNTINNDREHRGVDLVECDGAQDIGYVYNLFEPGYGTESGDYFDPYWSGNFSHSQYVNQSDSVIFASHTVPASISHDGAFTHIRIDGFSDHDTLMTCSIGSEWSLNGFEDPKYVGTGFSRGSMAAIPLQEGKAFVAVRDDGQVLAWSQQGQSLFPNKIVTIDHPWKGTVDYEWPLAASLDQSITHPIAAGILGTTPTWQVIAASNTSLFAIALHDQDNDQQADVKSIDVPASISSGPMLLYDTAQNPVVAVGTEQGQILYYQLQDEWNLVASVDVSASPIIATCRINADTCAVLAGDGQLLALAGTDPVWTLSLSLASDQAVMVSGHLDVDRVTDVVIVDAGGGLYTVSNGSLLFQNRWPGSEQKVMVALGEADQDGMPEILVQEPDQFWAFELTGALALNFPRALAVDTLLQNVASPLWLGDKSDNLILASHGVGLISDVSQRFSRDYPLTTSTLAVDLLSDDIDDDGDFDLFAISGDGFLYAWDVPASVVYPSWMSYGSDMARSFSLNNSVEDSAPESVLMAKSKVFCFPNPTENNETFIRYTLSRVADQISIRIYDLAGDLVQVLPAPGLTPGDHQIRWPVDQVQSGVYFARVEATEKSNSVVKMIKIAVVK